MFYMCCSMYPCTVYIPGIQNHHTTYISLFYLTLIISSEVFFIIFLFWRFQFNVNLKWTRIHKIRFRRIKKSRIRILCNVLRGQFLAFLEGLAPNQTVPLFFNKKKIYIFHLLIDMSFVLDSYISWMDGILFFSINAR